LNISETWKFMKQGRWVNRKHVKNERILSSV
jgi:hypothetical protein